ncbi:hypothetical protein BJV77DRAFT_982961 [Russula vinacea]|nr:hypothetical protein BJV77DRAFT_982961 [Russula vinacea]
MILLRRSPVFLIRTPQSPGRPCASWGRWSSSGAQMASRTLPTLSLQGKVCLVTGAARGLGNEFCRAFMRSGCTSVALFDLKQPEVQTAAEELVEFAASERLGLDALRVVGFDIRADAFMRTLEVFGRVDAVVASAGIIENYSALDYPSDRIKRLYDINVHGAFFTAREAAKHMIPQGGGSIILVASMSANVVNVPQVFQSP